MNAFEIILDGLGDEDGLCESNEACLYGPNFGAYQGEGDYRANGTCTFQPGAVTGVTLYAYPINGLSRVGNVAPVWDSVGPVEAGQPLTLHASDANLDALTYSCVSNCPVGLTVDALLGTVKWLAPQPSDVGSRAVVFRVTDGLLVADQTVQFTVRPGTTTVGPLSIAANGDDGSTWWANLNSTTGEMGTQDNFAFVRFAIPAGLSANATILDATLRLNGQGQRWWTGPDRRILIRLEDSSNAPAVTTSQNKPTGSQARALLSTSVRWPSTGDLEWAVGGPNTTPSLAPLLQALVARRGGLAPGAYVQFWLYNDVASNDVGSLYFTDFNSGNGKSAQLSITYAP